MHAYYVLYAHAAVYSDWNDFIKHEEVLTLKQLESKGYQFAWDSLIQKKGYPVLFSAQRQEA